MRKTTLVVGAGWAGRGGRAWPCRRPGRRARASRRDCRLLARPLRPAEAEHQSTDLQAPRGALSAGNETLPCARRVRALPGDYAERNQLDVRLATRVDRLDRDREGWLVRTSAGEMAAAQVNPPPATSTHPISPTGLAAANTEDGCCTRPNTALRNRSATWTCWSSDRDAPASRSPTTSPPAAPAASALRCARRPTSCSGPRVACPATFPRSQCSACRHRSPTPR
jgi:hypothetical protein